MDLRAFTNEAAPLHKSTLPELVTLSRNLRRAREESGLSQQALADKAGLHRSYLVSLEKGVGNPSLEKMVSLSTCLGLDVIDLLTPQPSTDRLMPKQKIDNDMVLRSVVEVLRNAGAIE